MNKKVVVLLSVIILGGIAFVGFASYVFIYNFVLNMNGKFVDLGHLNDRIELNYYLRNFEDLSIPGEYINTNIIEEIVKVYSDSVNDETFIRISLYDENENCNTVKYENNLNVYLDNLKDLKNKIELTHKYYCKVLYDDEEREIEEFCIYTNKPKDLIKVKNIDEDDYNDDYKDAENEEGYNDDYKESENEEDYNEEYEDENEETGVERNNINADDVLERFQELNGEDEE